MTLYPLLILYLYRDTVDLDTAGDLYHKVLNAAAHLCGNKVAMLGVYLYLNLGGLYLKSVDGNDILG